MVPRAVSQDSVSQLSVSGYTNAIYLTGTASFKKKRKKSGGFICVNVYVYVYCCLKCNVASVRVEVIDTVWSENLSMVARSLTGLGFFSFPRFYSLVNLKQFDT